MTTTTPATATAPATAEQGASLGEFRLYVPTDWFDLLEDSQDEVFARARITELMRLSYPRHDVELRGVFTDAVMAWRQRLLEQGALLHGIICVPPGQDPDVPEGGTWQVMAGAVNVPGDVRELDTGELLARLLGEEFAGMDPYSESYATAMGLGVGCVARPYVSAQGDLLTPEQATAEPDTTRIGLGVALSCPPGGGYGLLVMGSCLDPGQTAALGSLVAVIAGGSMLETEGHPTEAP